MSITKKGEPARCAVASGWAPFFFFTALGTLAMAAASVGNSLALQRLRAEVVELRATVAAMQNTPPQSQQPPQAP